MNAETPTQILRMGGKPSGIAVPTYLRSLGFNVEEFYARTNRFLLESRKDHFQRTTFLSVIADHSGMSVDGEDAKSKVFRHAAKKIYGKISPAWSMGRKWAKGIDDPEPNTLSRYFGQYAELATDAYDRLKNADPLYQWRLAIARTLTYIQVIPPADPSKRRGASDLLNECWDYILTHPHYTKSTGPVGNRRPTFDINHHCLDEILYRFGGDRQLVMKFDRLVEFRAAIDRRDGLESYEWGISWAIFTYITETIYQNHEIMNKKSHPCREIWGLPDEE